MTIKNKHSLDAHDVDASSECLVRSGGTNVGATFYRFDKGFPNLSPGLTIKVYQCFGASVLQCIGASVHL